MMLGGALFGTAFAVSGAGVAMHSLPLLYAGNILTKRLASDIICSFNNVFLLVLNQRYVIEKYELPTGNVIAGIGYGCSYTPPIQALLEWFPDKRGLASGVVIAGFGSGALFFTPAMNNFIQQFHKLPTYLGSSIETITEGGKQVSCSKMAKVILLNFRYFFTF